jgi:hypothetical protein
MASKGKAALTGAASGAAAGAALGPWGAAAGGVIGGALGYFGAGDDAPRAEYNPTASNFEYGLGPSSSYASQQSAKYNVRQGQLENLSNDAYNRDAPTMNLPDRRDFVGSEGQSYLQGADADARRRQIEALGGIQGQTSRFNDFADRPMGPSAAQATLRAGQDSAMRQQMGMARAQPGGGGAALRQAAFNAAGIQAQGANSAAILNAQETANHRQQQLQALGGAQQGAGMSAGLTGQIRGADQGFAATQAGQANYDAGQQNAYNQQQQQLEFGVGQANLSAAGQARGQNDAAALGFSGQSAAFEDRRNNLAAGQQAGGIAHENAKLQSVNVANGNAGANQAQANLETQQALNAASAGAGAVGGMLGGGGNPNSVNGVDISPGKTSFSADEAQRLASDVRAKKDIKPVSVLEALSGGKYSTGQTRDLYMQGLTERYGKQAQTNDARDRNALYSGGGGFDSDRSEFGGLKSGVGLGAAGDARQRRMSELAALGSPDFRNAQGYEYAYKDPERHGEGRYVGPMAQDLEQLPGVVEQDGDGTKTINAPRLTLANTAALSEQQRRDEEDRKRLERLEQMTALGGMPTGGTFSGYR